MNHTYQILATYIDLVNQYGVDSTQSVEFYESHQGNHEFVHLASVSFELRTLFASTVAANLIRWRLDPGPFTMVTYFYSSVIGLDTIRPAQENFQVLFSGRTGYWWREDEESPWNGPFVDPQAAWYDYHDSWSFGV